VEEALEHRRDSMCYFARHMPTPDTYLSTREIAPEERLIVALDVPDSDEARRLVDTLGEAAVFYKLGLELFMAGGYFELVDWLCERGRKVFVDLKLFDVPETVGAAVRQLRKRPVAFTTVHAGNDAILALVCRPIQPSVRSNPLLSIINTTM